MFKVADERGNCFFTDSKFLAEKVVKGNDNPFIKFSRVSKYIKRKIPKEHIVKTYADFCVYFY